MHIVCTELLHLQKPNTSHDPDQSIRHQMPSCYCTQNSQINSYWVPLISRDVILHLLRKRILVSWVGEVGGQDGVVDGEERLVRGQHQHEGGEMPLNTEDYLLRETKKSGLTCRRGFIVKLPAVGFMLATYCKGLGGLYFQFCSTQTNACLCVVDVL